MRENDNILVEYILGLEDGYVLTHEDIEDLLLIKSGNTAYYSFMRKVDKALLPHNRSLKVVKGVGYKILGSEAIIDKALKLAQQSQKKTAEAVSLIENIDRETLSQEYQLKFDVIRVKFVQLHSNLAGGVKELILLDSSKNKKKNRFREV